MHFGLYDTLWALSGQQPLVDKSSGTISLVGLQRSVARFDPHIALVYNPERNTSYRAAYGTSETFPFIGEVAGQAALSSPSYPYTAGIVTQKNPDLMPERSIAYDLGVDHRFKNGAVVSLDLNNTTVHNVIQNFTTSEAVDYNGVSAILGITAPLNVASLKVNSLTAKYEFAPQTGFGYNVSIAVDSSILSGIPVSAFNSSTTVPANGVQLCGTALFSLGQATCIPYLKGYGQLTYAWHGGTLAALGVDFEGKNNAYYQPPMSLFDFSFRQPISKFVDLQLSAQNLFNTNTYNNLAAPGGVPLTGNYSSDGVTVQQGTYQPFLVPAPPRTVRLQARFHLGR